MKQEICSFKTETSFRESRFFLRLQLQGGVSHLAVLQYGDDGKIVGGFCVHTQTHTIAYERAMMKRVSWFIGKETSDIHDA